MNFGDAAGFEPRHVDQAHQALLDAGLAEFCDRPEHGRACRTIARYLRDSEENGKRLLREAEVRDWAMG